MNDLLLSKNKEMRQELIAIIPDVSQNDNLVDIVSHYGNVIPGDNGELLQQLRALPVGSGIKNTFTNVYGYGAFPWHIDTAYWDLPVRRLALYSKCASPCATLYVPFDRIFTYNPMLLDYADAAVFLLWQPNGIRCVSFKQRINNETLYRYDAHIMRPYNEAAKIIDKGIKESLSKIQIDRIEWNGSNMAIIDNWKGIHSREDAKNDKNRELYRIYIQ